MLVIVVIIDLELNHRIHNNALLKFEIYIAEKFSILKSILS